MYVCVINEVKGKQHSCTAFCQGQKSCPINPGHSALQANALPAELDNSGVRYNIRQRQTSKNCTVHCHCVYMYIGMDGPDTTLSECAISAVLYGVVTAQFGSPLASDGSEPE